MVGDITGSDIEALVPLDSWTCEFDAARSFSGHKNCLRASWQDVKRFQLFARVPYHGDAN